uniref:Pre-rRNA-processing protein Ipi1 N-terminal domain-containing protein n=1 Tax=Phlebotomus papatasi TaxID=29031 RepID=A0A1B0DHD1_PHLPP
MWGLQIQNMGGWQLEVAKMAMYITFPVALFHYFNQPEYFEKWVTDMKRELYPPEDTSQNEEFRKAIRSVRVAKEKEILTPVSLNCSRIRIFFTLKSVFVNIKDLLGKLRQNNSSIKQDSLKSLKEAISSSPGEFFPKHLGEVVQSTGQLCLDVDRDVRRESFRCLQTLLGSIDITLMEPFFDMLSSYLRCAMTHLQNSIQEDSLLLLDVLLQHIPNLVAKESDRIFGNFLDMVSKLRSESKPGRTLSLNLGKKITAVKWRIRVLERLLKLLQAVNASVWIADTETAVKSIEFNDNGTFYCPIIKTPQKLWFEEISGMFIQEMSSLKQKNATKSADFSESRKVVYYVEQMVPLLVETWMEIRPQNFEEAEGSLGQEAASTISLIAGILDELWKMI